MGSVTFADTPLHLTFRKQAVHWKHIRDFPAAPRAIVGNIICTTSKTHRRQARDGAIIQRAYDRHTRLPEMREALKRYRDAVGADEFVAGMVPPFVPDWRFSSTP